MVIYLELYANAFGSLLLRFLELLLVMLVGGEKLQVNYRFHTFSLRPAVWRALLWSMHGTFALVRQSGHSFRRFFMLILESRRVNHVSHVHLPNWSC